MRNLLLIVRREYLERVRTRSFLIMTILIPALMFAAGVVPTLLASRASSEAKKLVVVASDAQTAEMIRAELQAQKNKKAGGQEEAAKKIAGPSQDVLPNLTVEVDTNPTEAERVILTEKVKQKELNGFLWATSDALAARKIDFVTNDVSSFIDNARIEQSVGEALRRQVLKSKGLSDADIETAFKRITLEARSPRGEGARDPQTMFLAVFFMVMVLYMTVLLYGINVMRAILEEKTSRIMEVMLSTANATEMMAGKIIGVGAVGLTQIGIWATVGAILSSGAVVAAATLIKGAVSIKALIFFGVFFLLGYALYSTLCAAVGSMVNSEQEAQQLQFVVMMPMIVSIILVVQVIQHPGASVAIWGSMIPFTAPLVMFTRIAVQTPEVPWWHIALSIGILLATIYGMVLLAGRIYRVGILMYGKKPTLPELMKWIRYA